MFGKKEIEDVTSWNMIHGYPCFTNWWKCS